MNGFGEFVDIGRNQVGDSKPQLQALRAGIDRLMLAPGYDQLKVFCGPVNAWVGYLLRDRF